MTLLVIIGLLVIVIWAGIEISTEERVNRRRLELAKRLSREEGAR